MQKLQKQHNCIPDEHYVQTLLAVCHRFPFYQCYMFAACCGCDLIATVVIVIHQFYLTISLHLLLNIDCFIYCGALC